MKKSLADKIEGYIKALIDRSENKQIEIQRAELAETFSCVPSQITYVIATRFNIKEGYFTESRRGGRGYVRIVECSSQCKEDISGVNALYNFLEQLLAMEKLTAREVDLIKAIFIYNSQEADYAWRKQIEKSTRDAIQAFIDEMNGI